jgi:hypothetical protein
VAQLKETSRTTSQGIVRLLVASPHYSMKTEHISDRGKIDGLRSLSINLVALSMIRLGLNRIGRHVTVSPCFEAFSLSLHLLRVR